MALICDLDTKEVLHVTLGIGRTYTQTSFIYDDTDFAFYRQYFFYHQQIFFPLVCGAILRVRLIPRRQERADGKTDKVGHHNTWKIAARIWSYSDMLRFV